MSETNQPDLSPQPQQSLSIRGLYRRNSRLLAASELAGGLSVGEFYSKEYIETMPRHTITVTRSIPDSTELEAWQYPDRDTLLYTFVGFMGLNTAGFQRMYPHILTSRGSIDENVPEPPAKRLRIPEVVELLQLSYDLQQVTN